MEEAARLEKAETNVMKKNRDKNSILDTDTSSWMVSSLQQSQITKSVSLPAARSSKPKENLLVTEFAESMKNGVISGGIYEAPPTMLPFDQFYDMFKEFSDKATSQQQQQHTAMQVQPSPEPSPKQQRRRGGGGGGKEGGRSRHSSVLSQSDSVSAINTKEDTSKAEEDTLDKSVEITNVVKDMMESDPNFAAFLKVTSNGDERLLKAKNNNSKVVQPKRLRTIAPLGKEAISLLDSRGRASKDASKGFLNHFKSSGMLQGADGQMSISAPLETLMLRTDDLIGRLSHHDEGTFRLSVLVHILLGCSSSVSC